MSTEVWKVISFAPNYAVSNHGRVRRETGGAGVRAGRILKPGYARGYPHVSLYYDGKMVTHEIHPLVAKHFLPPKPTHKHQVAHNDGQRGNCASTNLRWATAKENKADERLHGTAPIGMKNPRALITDNDVRFIRSHPKTYGSRLALAKQFGVSKRVIDRVRSREHWSHVND